MLQSVLTYARRAYAKGISGQGIRVGGRELGTLVGALTERRHYEALVGMFQVYERPLPLLYRYLFRAGSYPLDLQLATPLGPKRARLHVPDDLLTVNEIFCRQDYRADHDLRLVVDIGSNIGLSALYFLTRNPDCRAFLFEPVPANVAKLRQNLAGLESRYRLEPVCVGTVTGEVDFGVEPTGRYGGIGVETGEQLRLPCRDINDILDQVLATAGMGSDTRISLLKIDIEGQDWPVLTRIRSEYLDRIDIIYAEMVGTGLRLPGFTQAQRGLVSRWTRIAN